MLTKISLTIFLLIGFQTPLSGGCWERFALHTKGNKPRGSVTNAANSLKRRGISSQDGNRLLAIDLGAGAGNEVLWLLQQGWQVVAVDSSPGAVEIIRKRVHSRFSQSGRAPARIIHESIGDFDFSQFRPSLVHAAHTLYFLSKSEHDRVIEEIEATLITGGVVSGHFLGRKDSRARADKRSFDSEKSLRKYLRERNLQEISVKETKKRRSGKVRHYFEVTAIKSRET